jgi:hypothetical protein
VRVGVWLTGGILVVVAVTIAALAVRLSFGPINATAFAEEIRAGIVGSIGPGHQVAFDDAYLEWVQGAPRIGIRDLRVQRDGGTFVAAAETAHVGLNIVALVMGRAEPISLQARAPVLAATIGADGRLRLGGPDPTREPGRPTPIFALADPDVIGRAFGVHTPVVGHGSIARLVLDDAKVSLRDERSGLVHAFDRFDVSFVRRAFESFDAHLTVAGGHGTWRLAVSVGTPTDGTRAASMVLSDLAVPDLITGDPGPLAPLRLRAEARGTIDGDGVINHLTGALELSGSADVDIGDAHLSIGPTRLAMTFRPTQRLLEIASSPVRVSGVGGLLSGRAVLPAPGDPTRPVRFDVLLDQVVLDAAGTRVPEVTRFTGSGAYEIVTRTLWIDRAELSGEQPSALGRAQIVFAGATPAIRLEAMLKNIHAASAKRLWPSFIAPEAHEWFVDSVVDGTLVRADIALNVPEGHLDRRPLQREMFQASWQTRDTAVRLTPQLPPIMGLHGTIRSTGVSLHVQAENGYIDLPSGRVAFPAITYTADNMQLDDAFGVLETRAVGTAGALLDLADAQGVPIVRGGGFDARTLSGDGVANIKVTFPLYRETDQGEFRAEVDAELHNVAGRGVMEGRDLERGTFRIRTEGRGFAAEGSATVGGLPVRLTARQEAPGARLVLRAETETDEALRSRLGFDLSPYLTGRTTVRLVREIMGTEATRRLEVDLTQARLNLPHIAFEKARGTPASLSMTLRGQTRIASLEDVVLQGRGFSVRGRVRLGEDGQPNLVDLSDVRLRSEDQIAVRVERDATRTSVSITGRSIDVRPFLQRFLADDEGELPQGQLDLSVRVDRALGHDGAAISDLRLESSRLGPRVTALSLSGSLGGATRIVGDVRQDAGRPYLFVTSTDAGSLLRFFDLYRNMRGGRLTFTHTLTDLTGRRADGVVYIEDFRVVNDRALERLFGAAPQDPQPGPQRTLQSGTVPFDRMRVVFQRAPGVTQLSEGVLRNQLVGMTFEGQLNWRRQSLDLKGVFIPAYALNNLLARIPVIGAFLGGQNEGLIGATYAVSGPISGPTLQINPASALAPGVFRHLFSFPDPPGTARSPPPEPGRGN